MLSDAIRNCFESEDFEFNKEDGKMSKKRALFIFISVTLIALMFSSCLASLLVTPSLEGTWKRTWRASDGYTHSDTFYFTSSGTFTFERRCSVNGQLDYCSGTYSRSIHNGYYYVTLYYSGSHFSNYGSTDFRYDVVLDQLTFYGSSTYYFSRV